MAVGAGSTRLLLVPAVAAQAVLCAHRKAVCAPLAARRRAPHLVQHLLLEQHLLRTVLPALLSSAGRMPLGRRKPSACEDRCCAMLAEGAT